MWERGSLPATIPAQLRRPYRSRHPYAAPRTSLQCVCTRRRNCIEQLWPSERYAPAPPDFPALQQTAPVRETRRCTKAANPLGGFLPVRLGALAGSNEVDSGHAPRFQRVALKCYSARLDRDSARPCALLPQVVRIPPAAMAEPPPRSVAQWPAVGSAHHGGSSLKKIAARVRKRTEAPAPIPHSSAQAGPR
ncbi:hypothetical protein ACVWW1_003043 [Bradyrhizobium sp. JR3.5]